MLVNGCPPEHSTFSTSELAVAPEFRVPLFLVRWRTTASAFEPSTLLPGDATLVVEPCIRGAATTGDCLQWREAVSYGRDLAVVLVSEKVDVVIPSAESAHNVD